ESFQKALQLRKDCVEVQGNLGSAYRLLGKFPEAESAYKAALKLREDVPTYHGLGLTCQEQGKFADAEAAFKEAIRLVSKGGNQPEQLARVHSDLARALQDQGKLKEAEEHHRKAIQLRPKEPAYYNALGGYFCDYRRDYDAALAEVDKALLLNP